MDTPEPVVSVIIPTFNWSSALRYSVGSVLWQSFTNFELIVVGDGCTDDSEAVVASFADPRIRWHNLPENTGNQPGPNNAGLAMARGRYIAYLGHDDLWLPNHLEKMVGALDESGAEVAFSWVELLGPTPVQIRIVSGITMSGEYEIGTSVIPAGMAHRRDMIPRMDGPWRNYQSSCVPPEQEFLERAASHGLRFVSVKWLTALKFSAILRPNCYVEKPVHQQAEYTRRIQANPHFAAEELHDILEFLVRKHPENLGRNTAARNSRPGLLIENARRLRGLKPMELPPMPPPEHYPLLRGRIDLGEEQSAPHLWTGWSGLEQGFRWTDGHEAQVVFGLEKPQGPFELRVQAAGMIVGGKLDAQLVQVFCNGVEAGSWTVTQWELTPYTLRLEPGWLKAENILTFKLPNATPPIKLVEGSTDFRFLGLRVAWMELAGCDVGQL